MAAIPDNYADWKHCIEVDCGIPLTTSFCEQRLAALNDEQDPHTTSFRDKYGDAHLSRVIEWFGRALRSDAVQS